MATQTLQITLPEELAEKVRAKVRCGEYDNESAVIEDSLAGLLMQDDAVEHWLRTEVVAAYDALQANPESAVTLEQVKARLASEHAKRVSTL